MVPNGWKLTSLGMVCSGNLQTGPFGSQLHAHEYTDEGIPVLMPKDLNDFRANYESAAKIPQNRANDLSKHLLKSGDILFSRRGDVSRFALIEDGDQIGLCGTGCLKATPNPEHSSKFLSYFLQKDAVKRWLEQNAVGQTMPNMNTSILSELPLMVASSKDEEEKIAKILSTWDKAIGTSERLINNSKQQKKALMQQLLTAKKRLLDDSGKPFEGEWEEVKLSNVAEVVMGSSPKSASYNDNSEGLPLIQGNADIKNRKSVPRTYTSEVTKKCRIGDILLSVRAPVGTIAKSEHEACIGRGISAISTKKHHVQEYLYQWLLWFEPRWEKYSQGSTFEAVNSNDIKSLHLTVPSHSEQVKISAVLSNADQEIELLERQLADLKQEKKALMQQLLTGKRRVKI
jgi:type I restriction enzyme S subunit